MKVQGCFANTMRRKFPNHKLEQARLYEGYSEFILYGNRNIVITFIANEKTCVSCIELPYLIECKSLKEIVEAIESLINNE